VVRKIINGFHIKYKIILEKGENGRFSARVPSLPGCHSWGENREEANKNIKETLEGYLEVLHKSQKKRG